MGAQEPRDVEHVHAAGGGLDACRLGVAQHDLALAVECERARAAHLDRFAALEHAAVTDGQRHKLAGAERCQDLASRAPEAQVDRVGVAVVGRCDHPRDSGETGEAMGRH